MMHAPYMRPPARRLTRQIAYFLARFVSNIRSLSVDPIVVRSNWLDALNYVTDRGAQTLNGYARDGRSIHEDRLLGPSPLK